MVEFMLDHAGEIAIDPFVMGLEVSIYIFNMYARRPLHILRETGDREAALLHRLHLTVVVLQDMSIDESFLEARILGEVVLEHIKVDDDDTDRFADLRSCQTDTIGVRIRFKHVLDQLRQVGIIGRDILRDLAQYGLTVNINW